MKQLYIVLNFFFLTCTFNEAYSQAETDEWKWNNNLRSEKIKWADEQNGVLVALGGCSYFTSNGGQSWNCITTSTGITGNNSMKNAAMLSTQHMVVLTLTQVYSSFTGTNGFASTVNAGGNYFNDMSFANDNYGWVVGDNGIICKTINGGATWSSTFISFGNGNPYAVAFNSTTNGCVGTDNGKLFYTSDGGSNWTAATLSPLVTSDLTFSAIRYRNANEVIASAYSVTNHNSVIIRSTDGGHNWTAVHSAIAEEIRDMDFKNSDTAYAVGILLSPRYTNGPSLIYRSTDGGASWTQLNFNSITGCDFYGISFLNPSFGWIVGWQCQYKYDDGSVTGFSELQPADFGCSIYPNPVSDKLHVSVSFAGTATCNYEVFDVTGKSISSGEHASGDFDVNTNALSSGVYFMRIKHGEDVLVKKFSKQ